MPQQEGSFIDRIKLRLKAGDGGAGAVSFRHEKYVQLGGPDGGDGGKGGSVILRVNTGLNTLEKLHSQSFYHAQDGERGGKNNCTGANGADIVLEVPPGTVVFNEETGELALDMEDHPGGEAVLLKGGDGGKGNTRFATATNHAPRKATPGWPGEELTAVLEIKTVAQVGLIGLPNAGKSTLISSITGARPRVADYPFTTLQPVLGAVPLEDGGCFVIADIPGIIQGAHEGVGLGLDFLRHIERTRMLLYVIEISPHDPDQPARTLRDLQHEVRQYSEEILSRPFLIALNKVDLLDDEDELALVLDSFRAEWPGLPQDRVFVISARGKTNTETLRKKIISMYTELVRPIEKPDEPEQPFHPLNG